LSLNGIIHTKDVEQFSALLRCRFLFELKLTNYPHKEFTSVQKHQWSKFIPCLCNLNNTDEKCVLSMQRYKLS